jgi:uncharacterized membrane protein YsdA (DUF1294 family)
MPENLEIVLIALLVWNFIVLLVYAADKRRAIRKQWRVPESTLIALAWAGGGLGALLGMFMIRHKTRHLKFRISIPLAALLQGVVLAWLLLTK